MAAIVSSASYSGPRYQVQNKIASQKLIELADVEKAVVYTIQCVNLKEFRKMVYDWDDYNWHSFIDK